MTAPNLDDEALVALVASAIQSGRYGGRMFPAVNPVDFADARRVVAAIRDSGYTVIALPEATYSNGTRIAFEYSEPRRADIHCSRCLREIEAYGQLVHRGLVAGHAWRHVDDKSTTCLSLYPTGNCRPYDDYDADRMLAERSTQ